MSSSRRNSGSPAHKKSDLKPIQDFKYDEFETILLQRIKISQKNKKLRLRGNKLHKDPVDCLKFEDSEDASPKKSFSNKLQIPPEPIYEVTEECSEHMLEKSSAVLWYIFSPSVRKNMIPDAQFIEFSKTKKENMKNIMKKPEDLFNFGKMFCNEGNYIQGISYFSKAKSLATKVEKYIIWKSMAKLKMVDDYPKHKESTSSFCCSSRVSLTKKDYLMKIVSKLIIIPQSIESLWCLMEISLLNVLIPGRDIEPARFYAARIKKLDFFHGLLAWVEIYLKESSPDAPALLLELISAYPNRPEPYNMAWEYYYRKKRFDRSKEVAIEAFLKITPDDFEHFYVIFCLQLAKSYYYCGDFTNGIELLHKKYLEYPKYPVFLYILCKFCVLSEDFAFAGIAKGNLRELLRICDESRKGSIYYYLCKSYWLTRQFPQAFRYSFKALHFLSPKKKGKKTEMEKRMLELQPFVKKVQEIQEKLKGRADPERLLQSCEEIREFHRPSADLLKAEIFFANDRKNEAISLLKTMISTSRLETSAYFKLLAYDQLNTESIFKGLLAKAKNRQIPTQIWVKANLLYSKFMFKSCHYNKCFYVLRVLAKMLPPLPDLNLPYCNYLQNAENPQELATSVTVLSNDSPKSRPSTYLNVRDLTLKISEDAPLPKALPSMRQRTSENKKRNIFGSLAIEVNSDSSSGDERIVSPRDTQISNFCVCSKPKVLYYIAKFSSRIGRNKQEGLLALKDYMELLRLEKNSEKQLKLHRKAQKVLTALNVMES